MEWWDCRREKESQAGVLISRCTKLLHAMIKAGHSGGNVVVSGIMHTGIANMLMWQRIQEERGVRVTDLYRSSDLYLTDRKETMTIYPHSAPHR